MPKSQSKLLATEADFSCSKYTKRGGLRGVPRMGVTQDCG